jgi:hypothetical protein
MILMPHLNPKFTLVFAAPCAKFGFGALGMRAAGRYFSSERKSFFCVCRFEKLRFRKSS